MKLLSWKTGVFLLLAAVFLFRKDTVKTPLIPNSTTQNGRRSLAQSHFLIAC
jgi:hypothetical protein